jgi:catechol 2,3-dioxygenase-like lactoylglutathione lyase family enzyme
LGVTGDPHVTSISGFNHISLSVRDPAASAAWYRDVLGFEQHSEGQAATFRRIRMRHPASGVTLTLTGHEQATGEAFSELHAGLDHLAFTVGDGEIEAWKRRFEDAGVVHSDIRVTGTGGGIIALRDLDDIQLEVVAAPAG